jgi:hypothetical protein
MRLAGIIAMLRKNTGYLAPGRIAPDRQHHRPQPRSRARHTRMARHGKTGERRRH